MRIETHGFASRVARWMAMAISPAFLHAKLADKPLDVAWEKLDWSDTRTP
ncbi:hypothetical protein [Caballeronia sp. Lep1P3]|nr:hypothetical protein [Caballeronia sp. Lep1P3]